MSYSNSTFTIEINGTAAVIFQAKWHSEAEEVCRGWTHYHWEQLPTKGRYGSEVPLIVKMRLAHAGEKAMYDAEGANVEFYDGVKIVYLISLDALHQEKGADDRVG